MGPPPLLAWGANSRLPGLWVFPCAGHMLPNGLVQASCALPWAPRTPSPCCGDPSRPGRHLSFHLRPLRLHSFWDVQCRLLCTQLSTCLLWGRWVRAAGTLVLSPCQGGQVTRITMSVTSLKIDSLAGGAGDEAAAAVFPVSGRLEHVLDFLLVTTTRTMRNSRSQRWWQTA